MIIGAPPAPSVICWKHRRKSLMNEVFSVFEGGAAWESHNLLTRNNAAASRYTNFREPEARAKESLGRASSFIR